MTLKTYIDNGKKKMDTQLIDYENFSLRYLTVPVNVCFVKVYSRYMRRGGEIMQAESVCLPVMCSVKTGSIRGNFVRMFHGSGLEADRGGE